MQMVEANEANTPYVEEWYYYAGLVLASRGQIDAAREQFEQALVYNSRFQLAADTLAALDSGTFTAVQEIAE
jgi:tetratricopeptide (TPR) repeat protein